MEFPECFEIPTIREDFLGIFRRFDSETVEAFTQGRRPTMEDTSLVMDFEVEDCPVRILGLFDGHNGNRVAKFLQQEFGKRLQQKMTNLVRVYVEKWISETFQEIHQEAPFGGSTALVAVIFSGTACIANVGDSRALLITPFDFEVLTQDAKPTLPRFRREVVSQGGFVTNGRVNGRLGVARYIGNRDLGLNQAWADFTWILVHPRDILLLACDGLFERTINRNVAHIFRGIESKEGLKTIATQLIRQGMWSGSEDNISVLLNFIPDFETGSSDIEGFGDDFGDDYW